jgi:hypothetical protein
MRLVKFMEIKEDIRPYNTYDSNCKGCRWIRSIGYEPCGCPQLCRNNDKKEGLGDRADD